MTDTAAKIAALAAKAAGADAQAAGRIEQELRANFGGERLWIARRPPVDLATIDTGLRSCTSVAKIADNIGVSRATIYRRLKRRKSQPLTTRDKPAT